MELNEKTITEIQKKNLTIAILLTQVSELEEIISDNSEAQQS
jgi:hypothetical protein